MSNSWLACMKSLEQSIHNLKMRWPSGFKKLDDEADEKRKRLEHLYLEYKNEMFSPKHKRFKPTSS